MPIDGDAPREEVSSGVRVTHVRAIEEKQLEASFPQKRIDVGKQCLSAVERGEAHFDFDAEHGRQKSFARAKNVELGALRVDLEKAGILEVVR
jgi:hypothetical protein